MVVNAYRQLVVMVKDTVVIQNSRAIESPNKSCESRSVHDANALSPEGI
jgi:hypothetical protein